jgi:hypothetical protein
LIALTELEERMVAHPHKTARVVETTEGNNKSWQGNRRRGIKWWLLGMVCKGTRNLEGLEGAWGAKVGWIL